MQVLKEITNISEEELIIKFPFELDNFQKHAVKAINQDNNILVTAHTGSGKTIPAIHAIAHCIKKGKIAVYCSPIKSLSNEKYKEFREKFGKSFTEKTNLDVSVGILTGDNKINPEGNCLIMTTEILRNSLYDLKTAIDDSSKELKSNFLEKLGCVIFDEIHYISLPDRGHVWEESLVLLPNHVQIIGLSATIDHPEDFATWLTNIKKKSCCLIPTVKRSVPLRHYIFEDNKMHLILDENNKYNSKNYQEAYLLHKQEEKLRQKQHKPQINYNLIPELVLFLQKKNLLQSIFFSFSRNNCQLYASLIPKVITKSLLSPEDRVSVEKIFNFHMHKYEKQYNILQQYQDIKNLIYHGVAYHHSGLLPILKEIVEILFQMGFIKVLFATETFAVGVNMPTRTVVFTELEKYVDGKKRFLESHEFKQMAGRAGRRGIDTNGFCIILPLGSIPEESSLRHILLGRLMSIKSKFLFDYSFFLKIIQSNASDFNNFINHSLYFKQHIGVIKALEDQINKLTSQVEKLKDITQDANFNIINELYSLKNKNLELSSNLNIGISLSVQDKKKINSLEKQLSELKLNDLYHDFINYKKLNNELLELNNSYIEEKTFIEESQKNIINYLIDINYLTKLEDSQVNIKGIIASHINDCNSIILTEMITNNYFNKLEPAEIAALIAIFIDDSISGNTITLNDIECSDLVYNNILGVENLVNKFMDLEKKYNIISSKDYWKINYDYIDIAYYWASGYSVKECLDGQEIFEGNFIKNILKIHNIIRNMIGIYKLINNIEILPVLEKLEPLLIRDIVSVNSLYLS
jgi:antiviral helicase SKI2